ncbi:MAG: polysaccharide deacetylase family protein [Actinomycetota bacterium]
MSILCYHSVSDGWDWTYGVTTKAFDKHCSWLASRGSTIDLVDAVGRMSSSGRLSDGAVGITFDDGLSDVFDHAFPTLATYRLPATIFVVTKTLVDGNAGVDWIDEPFLSPPRALTRDQVLEMREAGIRFGSHSHTHAALTTLSDEECERELSESREVLEDILSTPVSFLAYPRGLESERVRRAARRAGFSHAFRTAKRSNAIDPYALPRVVVRRGDTQRKVRRKTSWWYSEVRTGRAALVSHRRTR